MTFFFSFHETIQDVMSNEHPGCCIETITCIIYDSIITILWMASYRYGLTLCLRKHSNSCNSISFWISKFYFKMCNEDTICLSWVEKTEKKSSSSAFPRFSKIVEIERNDIGEVKKFSIVVDGYVAMKYANFHIRVSNGSWDKRKKTAFPWALNSLI